MLILDASLLGFNILYSLGEIVCFISYAVRKHDLIFVGVYFTLSTRESDLPRIIVLLLIRPIADTVSLNSFLASCKLLSARLRPSSAYLCVTVNARSAFRNRERARTASAMMVLNTLPPSAHSSADTHTLFDSSAKSGEAFSDGPSHRDGSSEDYHTRHASGWLGWKSLQRA